MTPLSAITEWRVIWHRAHWQSSTPKMRRFARGRDAHLFARKVAHGCANDPTLVVTVQRRHIEAGPWETTPHTASPQPARRPSAAFDEFLP